MWKVYKWNGHYIMGELISKHSTEAAALKAAQKKINYVRAERSELSSFKRRNEIVIWLDSDNGTPMGLILKKIRKKKGDETVSTE
mgnify:CR=1 FL=1|tara:strand:- start:434 stop:688 length:255 start_codon:yes stop_codon:yes gene_type:complete